MRADAAARRARGFLRWLASVPASQRWAFALLGVNAFGTAYGVYWYHEQLAATPPWLWPLVPDSPLATLYFALFLASLLQRWPAGRGRGPSADPAGAAPPLRPPRPWLAALAYLANLKYGLWTPAIMVQFWVATGQLTFEGAHLSLSHLGMALQGFLYLRSYPPGLLPGLAAAAWLFLNDYADYWRGLHPLLPLPEATGFAAGAAVLLSAVALLLFLARDRL